jgi:pSer/pThr/pTyr-binding forkhead associated (FHA) protein
MEIRISWLDPITGEPRQPLLNTPIALGRDFSQLPTEINKRRVSRIQLNGDEVSCFHAVIAEENGLLVVIDQNSRSGISINNQPRLRGYLNNGDFLSVGGYQILVSQVGPSTSISGILFNPITDIPEQYVY